VQGVRQDTLAARFEALPGDDVIHQADYRLAHPFPQLRARHIVALVQRFD
jgi:hypothetical protein